VRYQLTPNGYSINTQFATKSLQLAYIMDVESHLNIKKDNNGKLSVL